MARGWIGSWSSIVPASVAATVTSARIRPVGDKSSERRVAPTARPESSADRRSFSQASASDPVARTFRHSDRSTCPRPERRASICSATPAVLMIPGYGRDRSGSVEEEAAHPPRLRPEAVLVPEVTLQEVERRAPFLDGLADQLGRQDHPRGKLRQAVVVGGVVQEEPVPEPEAHGGGGGAPPPPPGRQPPRGRGEGALRG